MPARRYRYFPPGRGSSGICKGPLNIESHGDILSDRSSGRYHTVNTGTSSAYGEEWHHYWVWWCLHSVNPQGEIEIHGPGLLSLKGQHNLQGPASEDFQLPDLPSSVCKECLKRAQELAQGFVPRDA